MKVEWAVELAAVGSALFAEAPSSSKTIGFAVQAGTKRAQRWKDRNSGITQSGV